MRRMMVVLAGVTIVQRSNSDRHFDSFNGSEISGNSVPFEDETWLALPFTSRTNSHAKTLAATIGYVSGTKRVNLGIYSDSDGTVGTLRPGGQASTTRIPDDGECCVLTKVTLPGAGVPLSKGT